jgi:hypothetical protein
MDCAVGASRIRTPTLMRIEDGPLSYEQAKETFEAELQHYLAGGELLPTCGGLSNGDIDDALWQVAGAVFNGVDLADAVAAAWAVFNESYPR